MNDLVITNVMVWAGSRPKAHRGWVAIANGKFSAIGAEGITGISKSGIEIDQVADFVMLSGDPFMYSTTVESTWINGERVYQNE